MRNFVGSILLFAAAAAAGCGSTASALDPQTIAAGAACLLSSEPEGGRAVLDIREEFTEGVEVVVIGRVGGIPDPFTEGKAAFVIADPSLACEVEGHSHAPGEHCPFCSRKQAENKESLALLEFVDDRGQVINGDARRLFSVQEGQMVVARGIPRLDPIGYLTITCTQLYIRE